MADLDAMTDHLTHRGPDGRGVHLDSELRVFLGHRRLSIVDIDGGAQPMWNEDGQVAVVFNGQIYNHLELRRELVASGHVFKSDHSDTEVLVHGYEEWGDRLPGRLNGMFAFCIFDRVRRRLFLARDRFGEKPLYYFARKGLFAFASEASALARHRGIDGGFDSVALQKLLAYGFIPAPNSALAGAKKLPGGSTLTFDIATGAMNTKTYWRFFVEPEDAMLRRTDASLAEELTSLLTDATRRRLMSDVPLGLFLSGGVDSSAVLAAAAQCRPAAELRTFTIGFNEPSYDESEWAATVAHTIGAQNEVEMLDMDKAAEIIPEVLARLDEPMGDASIVPTYLLSKFTRRKVTVALSGDGGDELFAGYDPFDALDIARTYSNIVPRPLHKLISEAAFRLPVSTRNMSFDFKLRRSLTGLSYPQSLWNPVWLSPVSPAQLNDLLASDVRAEDVYSEALSVWEASPTKNLEERTLEFYTNFYLQDGILAKVDRAAMMNSLESRAVFLDNDVVDFCRRLPYCFKRRNGKRKYLLKLALKNLLPAEILSRPKKGFGIPTAKWLKTIPTAPPLSPLPGFRTDKVAAAWAAHRAGTADHRLLLWSWLSMQSVKYDSTTA